MSEQENNTSSEEQSSTSVDQNVETQQVDTQSTEQVETTQVDTQVGNSMAIESNEESETSSESQPSIDDIIDEALTGELSEETQKIIDDNDLGKHIDMLVAGHQAIQEKNNQDIFEVVGGKESYTELQEWGKSNMSKEQQKSFNDALFSGDMNLAKLAVQGLQAQYVSANGKSPERVIEGGGTVNEVNGPYSDVKEYLKETSSRQYKQDLEYRAQVEARRNKSGF